MFYKFYCNECNSNIELNLKVDDLPDAKCSECGSGELNRIFSPVSQSWLVAGSYSSGKKGE